jgi:hypothetical protein
MTNNQVQFKEWRPPQHQPQQTKMVRWLMKLSGGLIKTERQANFVLILILVAVIITTILVLTLGGPKSPKISPAPAEEFSQTIP